MTLRILKKLFLPGLVTTIKIQLGLYLTICGIIDLYNSTPLFTASCIVSFSTTPVPAVSITILESAELAQSATNKLLQNHFLSQHDFSTHTTQLQLIFYTLAYLYMSILYKRKRNETNQPIR